MPQGTHLPLPDATLPTHSTLTASCLPAAEDVVGQVFCPHTLATARGNEVNMRMRSAHEGGVGLDFLDYGAGVRIDVPGGLTDFFLVQIPLRGRAHMQVGGAGIASDRLLATVPPRGRHFTLQFAQGTPQLIVYASRDRLLQAAQQVYGVQCDTLELSLQAQLGTPAGVRFLQQIRAHHELLETPQLDSPYARHLSSELLLARLLVAVGNTMSAGLNQWAATSTGQAASAGASQERLAARFREACEAGVREGQGLLEIANGLGVPLRTLQSSVKRVLGSTPSAVLREAQLFYAREQLQEADPATHTVSEIAARCGFAHAGRFAGVYREQFGESPSDTLAKVAPRRAGSQGGRGSGAHR